MTHWLQKQHGAYLLGPVVILLLVFIEFRNVFSRGFLVTPDLFQNFAAVPTLDGINIYLSKWNPAFLGNESAQPAGYALLALLTRAGILGQTLEEVVILGLVLAAAFSIWFLAKALVDNPIISPIAPTLYLTGPILFILIFNASVDLFLYSFLPVIVLLVARASRSPTLRNGAILGAVLALNCAFEPFAIAFVLPLLGAFLVGTWLTSSSRSHAVKFASTLAISVLSAVALNAPYYIGNLSYFSSTGVAGAANANLPVVQTTYGWSTPTLIFSLVGGGLYPRYAGYYPGWAQGLLLLVPVFAMVACLRPGEKQDTNLRISLAILVVFSIAWILLTRASVTLGILAAVPYLLVFNYPAAFYLFLGLCFALLATLGIDDIAQLRMRYSAGCRRDREDGEIESRPVHNSLHLDRILRNRRAWVAAAAILVAASVVPAGYYLESGDFRVFEAPNAIGFPAPWGAVAPSSFDEIYTFLQSHGGDSDARTLILPFPMFAGSPALPGFSINLFNQPEYVGQSYTGPFFQVPSAQEYGTTVLNYLIESRTDMIGIPLGVASVKYVIVDKQLNFTGPPEWEWSSLVGSPQNFTRLLNAQRDLQRVFDDDRISVYQNMDFKPYLQPFQGLTIYRQGQQTANETTTAFTWNFSRSNWTSVAPPERISYVLNQPEGYIVVGTGAAGNMSIQFSPNATWPSITGSSKGLDNNGFYIASDRAAVSDDDYMLRYTENYTGPEPHEGGYVVLAGWDANRTFLWESMTRGAELGPAGTVEFGFEPRLNDLRTTTVTVVVAFPYRFGDGVLASYQVSNLSLLRVPTPPPGDMLAPLVLSRMPSAYAPRSDSVVLWRDITPSIAAVLASYAGRTTYLCVGSCESNGTRSWDQLFLAHDSLAFVGGKESSSRAGDTVGGVRSDVSGPASAGLPLGGASVGAVYVRMSGNGTAAPVLDNLSLATVAVSSPSYRWYEWDLGRLLNAKSFNLSVSGNLRLDALLFTADAPTSVPTNATNASVEYSRISPTEYRGTASNNTDAILLAQGFNPSWSMQVDGHTVQTVPVAGWANLFLVPSGLSVASPNAFSIVFTTQQLHLALVGFQVGATIALGMFLLVPVCRRVWWEVMQFKRTRRINP